MAWNLTDRQVMMLKNAFSLFDCNGSGKIKRADLGNVLHELYQYLSESEIKTIQHEAEGDGNGFVTFDEFLTIMIRRLTLTTEDEFEQVFCLFDTDESGVITGQQIKEVLVLHGENVDDYFIEEVVRVFDENGDGKIPKRDLKRFMLTRE